VGGTPGELTNTALHRVFTKLSAHFVIHPVNVNMLCVETLKTVTKGKKVVTVLN
jgi:hypothetical protein